MRRPRCPRPPMHAGGGRRVLEDPAGRRARHRAGGSAARACVGEPRDRVPARRRAAAGPRRRPRANRSAVPLDRERASTARSGALAKGARARVAGALARGPSSRRMRGRRRSVARQRADGALRAPRPNPWRPARTAGPPVQGRARSRARRAGRRAALRASPLAVCAPACSTSPSKRSRSSSPGLTRSRCPGAWRTTRSGAQQGPKARDVAVERSARRVGLTLAPDRFYQSVARDGLVGMQQQHRQHGALLRPA